jgi:hypothetical protein
MKKIATLFGVDFYADTDDEKKALLLEDYILGLEAREKRISRKEIELDLTH